MRQFLSRLFIPFLFGCFIIVLSIAGGSCKKESLLNDGGELRFSTDTLTFDTVFTSLGSATIGVKIFNTQSKKINISSIRLAGGSSSPFRINVDGSPGSGNNIEVAANDSIYVFATVEIDPTNENTPFVVEDKLVATLNSRDFSIPIMAYGQNAHYIRDSVMPSQTWGDKDNKPYVVLGYAIVDSAQTLTINKGCRIYMHQNARLFVEGTLKATGTKADSIIFQGDRLDRSYFGYEGYPGEWGGIYFTSISTASELSHVVIRNCGNTAWGAYPAAVQVDSDAVNDLFPQLTLDRTIVENSIGYGLLSFSGNIVATNCLIHSCGAVTLALFQGGTYEINNCTFATYGSNKINHTDNPVAAILNYFYISQTKYKTAPLTCTLRNCVIAGSLEHEFVADSLKNAPANIMLESCLLKAQQSKIRPWVRQNNIRYTLADGTLDPMFVDAAKWNYRPKPGSPLIDSGIEYTLLPATDLDDKPRKSGLKPDIGCYEFQ